MARTKTKTGAKRPDPKPSRADQALATRTRLAEAALDLFAEHGYAKTSTRQIAQAAGVSEGLIFHHYPTKLDLLLGIVGQHELFAHRILALMAESDAKPVRAQLTAVAQGFVATLAPERRETKMLRLLLGESLTTPELGQFFRQKRQLVISTIVRYLEARIAAGELRANLDPVVAAGSLMGGLAWFFLTHQHLSARAWRNRSAAYSDSLVELWLRGALAAPDRTSKGSLA